MWGPLAAFQRDTGCVWTGCPQGPSSQTRKGHKGVRGRPRRPPESMVVLLVLGLVPSLAAAQFNWEIISQKNYNMAKISGIWYSIFMASDNMTRIEENGDLRVFMRNINPLKNGSLKFDFFFMVHGECVAVTMVCEKTENYGEFTVAYEGENRVLLTETDYRMYITFYMQNIKNGTKTHVLALYGNPTPVCSGILATGRLPVLSSSYLERFVNICKKYRLNSQNIIDLTNKDVCFPRRQKS